MAVLYKLIKITQNVNIPVLEPCAGVIVSAAARRSILVGGGGAPVSKNRQRRGVGANETGGLVVKSCIPMNPSLMSSSEH